MKMLFRKGTLILSLSVLLELTNHAQAALTHANSRHIEVLNDSGDKVAVDWINPVTGQALPYWQGGNGDKLSLDSFLNHTFVVRSADNHTSSFTVSAAKGETQVMIVQHGLELVQIKEEPMDNPVASELVFRCRIAADNALTRKVPTDKVMADLIQCLEKKTAEVLIVKNEEIAFQSMLRRELSNLAENYTCADPTMETSTPLQETTWTHNGVARQVGILHNRPSSQIHILHDFISRAECDAIKAAAKPSLHRGTVADGKGGSRLSENRKAWQAGLKVDWSKEASGDLIAAVSRRLIDYANHVTGYNMKVEGQEDLMSIQYFGNGTENPSPDRYTPHCDGDCDGLPHKTGGRVATMVMYCDIPELGGGTNFQNSNVFVKPKAGAAAFFSYMDQKTRLHDEGYTSHSGCPVLQGTKRIAVQWMRVGVDKENPWNSFDTNTVKISSKTDQDDEEEETFDTNSVKISSKIDQDDEEEETCGASATTDEEDFDEEDFDGEDFDQED